jgi:glycosyltransferase involved in cell wall biosynthesis
LAALNITKPVATFNGAKICVVSRCASTLFTFRRKIIFALQDAHATVIAIGGSGDGFEEKVKKTGATFMPVPMSFRGLNPLADFCTFWAYYKIFRFEKPAGVQLYTIKPVIYGCIAAKLAGVPAVSAMITGLGHIFTSPRPILRRLGMLLYRLALQYAQIVYFQNPTDRDFFLTNGLIRAGQARLVNGSGVDIEEFSVRQRHVSDPNKMHFLMIGRLIREKGVLEFFEAARIVGKIYPQTVFSLVGEIDPRNPSALSAADITRASVESSVKLLGHLEDVRDAIDAADVVVLPSYREGTPKSLLEAAAMGKPMLASNVPGCTEVVFEGQTGYLFPARDAKALAAAMIKCIKAPERLVQMGHQARALAVEKFDVRIVNFQLVSDMQALILAQAELNSSKTETL